MEVPKVCCTVIKRTLQKIEGCEKDISEIPIKSMTTLKGISNSGMSFHDIFHSKKLFKFTFIRNPYTRILSCYLDKIQSKNIVPDSQQYHEYYDALNLDFNKEISFKEFLLALKKDENLTKNTHWTPQFLLIKDSRISYDFIGRFENFENDFKFVLEQIGKPDAIIANHFPEKIRTNANFRIKEFYGETEKALVSELYECDFRRYNYSIDSI